MGFVLAEFWRLRTTRNKESVLSSNLVIGVLLGRGNVLRNEKGLLETLRRRNSK